MNVATGASEPEFPRPQTIAPNGVIAMLMVVATEVMFFAGLVSAFTVTKAGVPWPPPDQPRLPVEATAFNTVVLLASGLALRRAGRAFAEFDPERTRRALGLAVGLGVFFIVFQGYEWARLLSFGLTMQASTYGAFFYLLVGAHALHVAAALLVLGYCRVRLARGELTRATFTATQIFWYFVVLLWPVLYVLVYLL